MKKIPALVAILVSVPVLTLGLIFLIAAMAKAERILVAGALLIAGLLPLAWGIRGLRRQAELEPQALEAGIIALARRLGGEVTIAQVQAEFRLGAAQALEALEKLRASGQADAQAREGRTVYVVRGLQPALVRRRCPHCGSNYPVKEALRECPNCGASLELYKT